jgi:hypothetical protein
MQLIKYFLVTWLCVNQLFFYSQILLNITTTHYNKKYYILSSMYLTKLSSLNILHETLSGGPLPNLLMWKLVGLISLSTGWGGFDFPFIYVVKLSKEFF